MCIFVCAMRANVRLYHIPCNSRTRFSQSSSRVKAHEWKLRPLRFAPTCQRATLRTQCFVNRRLPLDRRACFRMGPALPEPGQALCPRDPPLECHLVCCRSRGRWKDAKRRALALHLLSNSMRLFFCGACLQTCRHRGSRNNGESRCIDGHGACGILQKPSGCLVPARAHPENG